MAKRVKKRPPAASKTRALPSGRHAVIGIDPGGTTGLFCAAVELQPTMKKTVATLEHTWMDQITGDYLEQAAQIASVTRDVIAQANMDGVALSSFHVVFEDWDTGRVNPGRELQSVWVMAAAGALLLEGRNGPLKRDQVSFQYAAQAKGYATDQRLKLWGLYDLTKGKPHARDASRHWALRVNQLVG